MMKIKKDLFFSDLLSIKKGTKDGTIFNINKTYGNGTILMYKIIEGLYLACSELEFKDIVKISTAGNYCSDIIAIDYCVEGQCICNFRNSRIAFAQKGGSIYYAGKNHSLCLFDFKGKLYKSITIFCYLNKIIDSLGKIFEISREKIEKCYNELSVKIDFLNVKTHDDVLILLNEIYKYIKCNSLELIKLRTIELFLLEINNYEKYNNQKKKDYTKGMINKMERIRNTIAQSYYKDYTIKDLAENEKMSPTSLKACFKDVCKDTIYSYKKRCRMTKARKLLLGTEYKVYEIALLVGYHEAAMFIKAFKKTYNMTPKACMLIRLLLSGFLWKEQNSIWETIFYRLITG